MSNKFLDKENIVLLWDVLSDENIIKTQTQETILKINEIFRNNIKAFFENERHKSNNLIEMNKKYIMLILNFVNNNFNLTLEPNKNKNKDKDKDKDKELVTYDEIQNDRRSQFEKSLSKKQEEFTNYMTVTVPTVPKFSDNYQDTPISEMENIIKEITAQRNYEIEQINRNYNINPIDNWLKPTETSIKTEKIQEAELIRISDKNNNIDNVNRNFNKNNNNINNNNNSIKYIKIENQLLDDQIFKDEIIDLNNKQNSPKKSISWGENKTREFEELNNIDYEDGYETNIFKKLKKVKTSVPNDANNANDEIYPNDINKSIINSNEYKIELLQNNFNILNSKIELMNNNINSILEMLKNKNE